MSHNAQQEREVPFLLSVQREVVTGLRLRASNVLTPHQLIEVADHKFWTAKIQISVKIAAAEGAAGAVRMWWLPNGCAGGWDERYLNTLQLVNEETKGDGLTVPDMDPREVSADEQIGTICICPEAFVTDARSVSCVLTIKNQDFAAHYRRPGLHENIKVQTARAQVLTSQREDTEQKLASTA